MSDPNETTVNLISGDGVAPDQDTIGVDPVTGKQQVVRVPGSALPAEILGEGLELKNDTFQVKINETPDDLDYTGLSKSSEGIRIKGDSNGAGKRYIGTDHTEVATPNPGDIYFEIGPEV